jgi:uncharacterized protein
LPSVEQARAWYDVRDPVHGWDHVLRVYRMAEQLAQETGADVEIVRAAALLHDVADAAPGEEGQRKKHELASALFAEGVLSSEGWPRERVMQVLHCIRAHRFRGREKPETLEARVLFDADKLDVIGAFGIARTIGYALQAGQPIYAQPSTAFRTEGRKEPGEPHSAYHEYLFKLRHVKERLHTPAAHSIASKRQRMLEGFFAQLAAEAGGAEETIRTVSENSPHGITEGR